MPDPRTREELLDELKELREEIDRLRRVDKERDQYVKALNEKAQSFSSVLEASPIVLTITRKRDGRFMLVNPAHGRESGYASEEVLGKTSVELDMYVNQSDREAFIRILKETGELNHFELQYRNKDGSVRDVLLYARPLVYAGEDCIITASLSITERKEAEEKLTAYRDQLENLVKERTSALEAEISERGQAEEALKASRQHLSQIIDFLPNATFAIDHKGRVVVWNAAIERMTGVKAKEMLGKGDYEYAIPFYGERRPVLIDLVGEWDQETEKKYAYVKRVGQSLVSETYDPLVKPGGFLQNKASLLYDSHGEVIGAIESIRDITERKVAEKALSEKEALLRATLESAADGILVVNKEGVVTYSNDRFAQMWQIPELLVKTKNDEKLIAYVLDQLTEPQAFLSKTRSLYRSSEEGFDTLLFKDGRVFERFSSPLLRDGNIEGRVWSFRDVTEKRHLERELIHSKNFLENIFNSSIDGITATDLHGNVTYTTPRFREITGFSLDEIMGQKAYAFYGKGKEDAKEIMKALKKEGELPLHEMRLKKKDGGFIDIITSISYMKNENGEVTGTLGIFKDITERRRFEIQLQNAQKMDAIAVLAGGIAHKFNNALSVITGNADLLKMEFPEDEKVVQYIKPMKQSAHHMAHLTRQLLAYARGGKYNPQTVSLNDFVKSTLPLIEHTLDPHVALETDLSDPMMDAEIDHTQMQMVLSAVIANANDAIEGGGRIRVGVREVTGDGPLVERHPDLRPGPYLSLVVEDDGRGMDEETRARIFEPFFTTNFMGRGLGMAAVYGIIRNHDGLISVESELGKGTRVVINLPAVKRADRVPEARDQGGEARDHRSHGGCTILVVEDEEVVLDVTQAMLKALGYRVLTATTGKEAIHICETFDGDMDLALLDIKLPDMEGGQVYPRIMAARPGLKVIVCSGYAIDGPAQKILDRGAQGFMQKPVSLAQMSEKLEEVLKDKS